MKPCLICGAKADDNAKACAACGECSFGAVAASAPKPATVMAPVQTPAMTPSEPAVVEPSPQPVRRGRR